MILCGDGCHPVCDFCIWYNFNGDEEGTYTGDGWCKLHKRPRDPGDYCNDYHCFNVGKNKTCAEETTHE